MAPRPPTTTHATTQTNPLGHLHRDTPITARRTRGTRLAQHRKHPRLTINRGDDTVVVVAAVKASPPTGWSQTPVRAPAGHHDDSAVTSGLCQLPSRPHPGTTSSIAWPDQTGPPTAVYAPTR